MTVRYGRLTMRSFATEAVERPVDRSALVEKVSDRHRSRLDVADVAVDGARVVVTLAEEVERSAGDTLVVRVL